MGPAESRVPEKSSKYFIPRNICHLFQMYIAQHFLIAKFPYMDRLLQYEDILDREEVGRGLDQQNTLQVYYFVFIEVLVINPIIL